MTSIARRESLLDFWTRFYAERPSTVDVATELVVARGFDRKESERAREKALEIRLYNVPLPPCAIGIPRAWMNKMPRGRA